MLRKVLIAGALLAVLGAGPVVAQSTTTDCSKLTNPILKKACLAKPPPSPCDPSNPKPGSTCGVSK